ncbi:hypothetical protein [Histidinibacterium lentulum]|uniref:Uncharacterized protein n=1 Tax=Histidinibacterium lentulum TaxID=2480588 RepID=A0A3N2QR99_9RHOB|nr:hypothetical protein [Histidinibacterium lentulum]ROT97736.1 hypothetical protein EAT49_18180 [Histidinibacterium lentulum]
MAEMQLTKTRLTGGIWEGVLTGASDRPRLVATHLERSLPGLELTPVAEGHLVRLPIPSEVLSDGVQTVLFSDAATGARLASVAILAGDALTEDIRAEVALLRAELDMLKRAFRRHCTETA